MNRTEYRTARALVRANGNFALGWLAPQHAAVFRALDNQANDDLRIRARLEKRAILRIACWPMGPRTDQLARRIFAKVRAAAGIN